MRQTVRKLSSGDLLSLADEWGLDVDEREAKTLVPRVNRRLEGLDDVYELGKPSVEDPGSRPWHVPTDDEDPYNALVTCCDIPPSKSGPLSGVEIGVKDNIAVAGIPMQCGSAVMEGFIPSEDATVVESLRAAGAQITAKTNLDEFAGGGRGLAVDGSILHPMDTERYPGGSSGGSAAAVLADQVDVALGTDTGGSVRAPAALCGLVGVKPTYGLVPLTGVIENTYSLDHVGVISETVEQAAACLDTIAGKDERDPASMAAAGHDDYECGGYADAADEATPIEDLCLARFSEPFETGEQRVSEQVEGGLTTLEDSGATIVDVSIPEFDLVDTLKNCLTYPELAQYWRDGALPLRRGRGGDSRDQVGFARRAKAANGELNPFYRGRILTGARLLTSHDGRHYTRALAACRELRAKVVDALDEADADALVCATVPGVAPRHEDADDPGFGITGNTRFANVTELPAMTLPCGTVDELPVGIQLVGRKFDERTLFRHVATLEHHLPAVADE